MRLARRLLGIACFVAILVLGWRFAADHAAPVTIKTPVAEGTAVSLWVALLVAFALGAVLAGAAAAVRMARMGLLARRYRKVIRGLESEIHQLRNLPLSNDEPVLAGPASGTGESPAPKRALGRGA
jgi:uncharacterized integral membrane protein